MSDNAVNGVSIELGEVTLHVADLKKPLWNGDYYGGKLSIYHATSEPSIIPACISIVIIFQTPLLGEQVMISHYELNVPFDNIVTHIQTNAIIAYHKLAAELQVQAGKYPPAPNTLQ